MEPEKTKKPIKKSEDDEFDELIEGLVAIALAARRLVKKAIAMRKNHAPAVQIPEEIEEKENGKNE